MSSSFEFYKNLIDSNDISSSGIAIFIGILVIIFTAGKFVIYLLVYSMEKFDIIFLLKLLTFVMLAIELIPNIFELNQFFLKSVF